MKNTFKLSDDSYLSLADNNLNYFEIVGRESTNDPSIEKFTDWKDNTLDVGNYKVIPFGISNDIPQQIQEAILPNWFANRATKRKAELLVEQGYYIYEQVVDGTKYLRKPIENQPITDWIESIGGEKIFHLNAIDYYAQEAVFTKVFRSREGRITQGVPVFVEHVSAFSCRLAYLKTDTRKKPTHIIVGDWVNNDKKTMVVYPIFNPLEPTKYPIAIHYVNLGAYGMQDYPLPDTYGSLEWIKNTTNTPKIFNAFGKNSLNIKWHIQSPQKYWEDKRTILQNNCKAANPVIPYSEKMLETLKTDILDKLSSLLSGVENVGKFWHNEYVVELVGANAMEHGWKIEPIEQKTKEWVESQVRIHETAVNSMKASVGLHSSLAMVGADGKSDSGSEQYYAYAIHQKTATPIPEYYVCKAINDVIKVLFKTNLKVGFYRTQPERQQDITNSQRLITSTEQP